MLQSDDFWSNIPCKVCKSTDPENDDVAMICDGCNDVVHTFCLQPPLDVVPDGHWFCDECDDRMDRAINASMPSSPRVIYKDDSSDSDSNAQTSVTDDRSDREQIPSDDNDEEEERKRTVTQKDEEDEDIKVRVRMKPKQKMIKIRPRTRSRRRNNKKYKDHMKPQGGHSKNKRARSDAASNEWNNNNRSKRRKIDKFDLGYFGKTEKEEGFEIVMDNDGQEMWSFTLEKRKRIKR